MPEAARVGDPIGHTQAMNGLLAGLAIGALAGAAILLTGGAALPFVVAGAVMGASVAGGIGETIGSMSFMPLDISGAIITGSPNVMINGRPAAHAHLSLCACSHHSPPIVIAQGSKGVYINGKPASRKGDLTVCSAKIAAGSPNVRIGGGTVTTDKISPEIPDWVNTCLEVAGLASACVLFGPVAAIVGFAGSIVGGDIGGAIGGAMFGKGSDGQKICALLGAFMGGAAAGGLMEAPVEAPIESEPVVEPVDEAPVTPAEQAAPPEEPANTENSESQSESSEQDPADANPNPKCDGDPVDVISGQVRINSTDFVLPGALPVTLSRTYCSGFEDTGCFGPKWRSSWGAFIHDRGSVVSYVSADGLKLKFSLRGRRDTSGWLSNPLAPKVKLRRSRSGFEVLERDRNILSFDFYQKDSWLLSQINHPNGHSIQFTRSRAGALRMVEHSGGYRLHITGTVTQIWQVFLELADGSQRRLMAYQYDANGHLAGIINGSNLPLTYAYDDQGRIVRWADREDTWYGYAYDERGRVSHVYGAHDVFSGDFQYDQAHRTTVFTDSHGYRKTYKYDDSHNVVEFRDALDAVTHTLWNRAGLKTAEINANGNLTAYEYDAQGNLLTLADANGNTTHYTYNEFGLPNSIVDAQGNVWLRDYDERGNLIAAGLSGQKLWRYERDFAGNLVQITDPEGRSRRFTYDSRGLPVSVMDALGHSTTYTRDDFGRITSEINALGQETCYRYNDLQKLSDVFMPDGSRLHWDYNPEGLVIRRVAADGSSYKYSYGAFDKLAQVDKPSGGALRFGYDLEARVRAIENERGEFYRFEHDPVGRIISETDFTGRTIQYDYDLAGFCIKRVNGAGETSYYTRDNVGRLLTKRHSDGTTESFTYNAVGNLASATNSATTVTFERDAFGRVIKETQGDHVLSHTYDGGGLRIARQTSTGTECSWTYDANGFLNALNLPNDEQILIGRDALSRETSCQFGKDFTLLQNYDVMGRLTHQLAETVERTFQYDSVSNPVQIDDRKWGTARFTYDRDGRLTSAAREDGLSEDFEYDAAGNIRTAIRRDKPQAQAKFRTRLLSYGGRLELADQTKYFYDKDGRVSEKWDGRKVWKYQWSTEGRLNSVLTPNGQRWTYEYDPLGRRIRKTGPNGTSQFIWDGPTLAEVLTPEGHKTAWFYQPGTFRPIAKLDQETVYACVTDQIGTPKELVARDGSIAWSSQLTAFGELEKGSPDATTRCNLRFQGQYRDEETGLHYNFHRYYEPQTGRYLSPDPIGLEGGTRSYGYVHNPLSWIDPLGLAGCAHVDDQGTLNLKNKFDPGSPEDTALQQHVSNWNQQIQNNGGSMTRQAVTPGMRAAADDAATSARSANPELYPNGSVAAGHTPDVGWGGNVQGPINPLNSTVNSYVGGATRAVPAGTTYNNVVLFR